MSSDPSVRPPARSSIAPAARAPEAADGAVGGPVARRAAALLALGAAVAVAPLPAAADAASGAGAPAASTGPALLALPGLANTPEGDRELLLEVADDHVHVRRPPRDGLAVAPPAAAPEATRTAVPAAPTPAGAAPDRAAAPVPEIRPPGSAVAALPTAPPAAASPPADVWSRIRESARLPADGDRAALAELRQEYLAEAPWVTRILERGTPYLAHLVDELDRRFLPLGLAVLPAVESGFRTDVESAGSAVGLWQIVPITAEEIGLERSLWFDARADIVASTGAALDYLSYLNAEFDGDWELTLAAYNAGPGRVRAAMAANAKAGKPVDFWSLPLPAETRRYVPKVLALVSLLREDPSPILVPEVGEDGFERVDVGLRISLDRAAALSGLSEEVLRSLNAGLVHGVTAPEGPHALYLPRGEAEAFLASIAGADGAALYSLPRVHRVAPGETLSGIAHRYGLSQDELARMNALTGTRILAGQELAVLDVRRAGAVEVEYVVGAGDTLSGIAESHAVGLGDISRADGSPLDGDLIHPGQTLSISVGGRDGTG